jgi:hypothetical protein
MSRHQEQTASRHTHSREHSPRMMIGESNHPGQSNKLGRAVPASRAATGEPVRTCGTQVEACRCGSCRPLLQAVPSLWGQPSTGREVDLGDAHELGGPVVRVERLLGKFPHLIAPCGFQKNPRRAAADKARRQHARQKQQSMEGDRRTLRHGTHR